MDQQINFLLNGNSITCKVSRQTTLLQVLRDRLGLTGTKMGCESGDCGACSVLVEDQLVKACQTPAVKVAGRSVTTIEGIHAPDGGPGDLQQAFLRHGATQCGYCIPAMILAGEALLRQNRNPNRSEIFTAISPVLCRCTGYQQIVDAIEDVARIRARGEGSYRTAIGAKATATAASIAREYAYIGNLTIQAADGLEKVMGQAKYVGDMRLPGMLYANVLHSPLPHAQIISLDVSPALSVPGVLAAITSDDFVDHGAFGWPLRDAFILAYQKVRYVGDPIAVVAAESEAAAQAGVRAIQLELQPLPVIGDPHQSLNGTAAIIPDNSGRDSNLCTSHLVRNGDPASILAECLVQLDQTYTFQHQEHAYIETEGALAVPQVDGSVTIYANDQSPFINRDNAAAVLGLPKEKVRVIQPPVGGSFGGKDDIGYQCSAQAARLALLTGRPVRLVLERSESLAASYKREGMEIHLRLGANSDGSLRAAHADLLADSGAYASMTPLSSWRATMHAAGCYRYEAATVDTRVVYTNNGYSGAFRGFGNPQACAAIEIAIDELAFQLGRDPIDFRLQNILRKGDRAFTGNIIQHDVYVGRCLEWVRQVSDWDHRRAQYSAQPIEMEVRCGIGVACYFHGSGLGGEGLDYANASLRIEADYSLTLQHGMTDYGQGSRTVFTLLAAEVLGVDPERIHMLRPDTQTAIESGPTVASRATLVGGNAVRVTAEKLAQTLHMAAADLLDCEPDEVRCLAGHFISPHENDATFEQVVDHARQMGLQLSAQGYWQIPQIHWDFKTGKGTPYYTYCYGAQVAEVEVNLQKGTIKVLKIWAAHDAGKVLFPGGAKGQMIGGIVQGLGYALTEGFTFTNGYPVKLSLNQYTIPTALDVPEIDLTYLDTIQPEGPFGAKGLAEPTLVATAPAIANAVFQASGQRLRALPLKLENIIEED
jgi:CO/xanthine dehydrogenase Mo-binding subunit/aerobic-type carbon monoxide dehydrogenase small subunit (CoxS/CutS family)